MPELAEVADAQHKSFSLVDTDTDPAGTFEATVAVFGNVDYEGDRIMPGAFTRSLAKWQQTGDPIPVILSHQHNDPMAHIGIVEAHNIRQTSKGLVVRGTLDIEQNEVARQVYRLMARRSLKEFSFGYLIDAGGARRGRDKVRELTSLHIFELGPTLVGANPSTELHAVKTALAGALAEPSYDDPEADGRDAYHELLYQRAFAETKTLLGLDDHSAPVTHTTTPKAMPRSNQPIQVARFDA